MLLLNYWTLAVFVISVLYLAFILWLSIGFGSNGHPPAEPQPYNINSQLTENEIKSLNNNADY